MLSVLVLACNADSLRDVNAVSGHITCTVDGCDSVSCTLRYQTVKGEMFGGLYTTFLAIFHEDHGGNNLSIQIQIFF